MFSGMSGFASTRLEQTWVLPGIWPVPVVASVSFNREKGGTERVHGDFLLCE